MNDEFREGFELTYLDKLCMERKHIKRIGGVDEIFRWATKLRGWFKVVNETNNVGAEASKQFKKKMLIYGIRFIFVEVASVRNKIERILDTLKPYFESRAVYTKRGQETLAHQIQYIGKTKWDDEADIFATVVMNLAKPQEIKYEDVVEQEEEMPNPLKQHFKNKFNRKLKVTELWQTK